MADGQSWRTCHCGWSSVTTYRGLRIHQGKKGCTPKGTHFPQRPQQIIFNTYIPNITCTPEPRIDNFLLRQVLEESQNCFEDFAPNLFQARNVQWPRLPAANTDIQQLVLETEAETPNAESTVAKENKPLFGGARQPLRAPDDGSETQNALDSVIGAQQTLSCKKADVAMQRKENTPGFGTTWPTFGGFGNNNQTPACPSGAQELTAFAAESSPDQGRRQNVGRPQQLQSLFRQTPWCFSSGAQGMMFGSSSSSSSQPEPRASADVTKERQMNVSTITPSTANAAVATSGPVTPPAGPVTPPSGPVTPPAGPVTPPSGPVTLPAGPVTPQTGLVNPPAGLVTPKAGLVTPPAGPVTPQAGPVTPPAGSVTPPAGPVTPPSGPVTLPAGPVTAQAGTVTPPARMFTPKAGKVTPPAGPVTPPAGQVTPQAGPVTPPSRPVTSQAGAGHEHDSYFETPQQNSHGSVAAGNNSRRALDFSTGTPQVRRQRVKAELQQKIGCREQKLRQIRACVKTCSGSLDAEWLEIDGVFSSVIHMVEEARHRALQPLDNRREQLKRESQSLINKIQEDINKLAKAIEEVDNAEDFDVETLSKPRIKDVTKLNVRTSYTFGTLRTTISTMTEEIQEELDKLSALELKRAPAFAVDVKLDPDTAHQSLLVSKDAKRVQDGGQVQRLPPRAGRFDLFGSILGAAHFSSGRAYWEVQVGGKSGWDLGVASANANRRGWLTLSPQNGYWAIVHFEGDKYAAMTAPPVCLRLKRRPRTVGVFLDCEEGLVSFYDVAERAHIYSFTKCGFDGEVFPYFSPHPEQNGRNSEPLVIV